MMPSLNRRFRHAKRWVQCRTIPGKMLHWVKTDLEPSTWYDADHRMLHACFSLLCSFVEDEHGGESKLREWAEELRDNSEAWGAPGCTLQEATRLRESLALYRWWKIEKPADCARRDEMLHHLYRDSVLERVKDEDTGELRHKVMPLEWHSQRDDFRLLEQKIDDDEQSMLHRLIEIRTSLWT